MVVLSKNALQPIYVLNAARYRTIVSFMWYDVSSCIETNDLEKTISAVFAGGISTCNSQVLKQHFLFLFHLVCQMWKTQKVPHVQWLEDVVSCIFQALLYNYRSMCVNISSIKQWLNIRWYIFGKWLGTQYKCIILMYHKEWRSGEYI